MEEILHQFIGILVYPIIYRVSYIPGGARFQPSTVVTNISSTKKRPKTNQEFSPNFVESAEVLLLSPYIGGDTVQQHG